jgi:hypothetical protein
LQGGTHRLELISLPLGMGLDEAAAKSVLAYEFRPAMCHDKPFTAYVEIGVGFQSR